MSIGSFIFLSILNLLIACVLAFFVIFVFKLRVVGDFWGAAIIALIGAVLGTVLGIYLGNRGLGSEIFLIRYLMPVLCSAIFLFVFALLSRRHRDD